MSGAKIGIGCKARGYMDSIQVMFGIRKWESFKVSGTNLELHVR